MQSWQCHFQIENQAKPERPPINQVGELIQFVFFFCCQFLFKQRSKLALPQHRPEKANKYVPPIDAGENNQSTDVHYDNQLSQTQTQSVAQSIQSNAIGLILQQISGIQIAAVLQQQYSGVYQEQSITPQTQQMNNPPQMASVLEQIAALVTNQTQQLPNGAEQQSNLSYQHRQYQQNHEWQNQEDQSETLVNEEPGASSIQQLLSNIGFPEALHTTILQTLEMPLQQTQSQPSANSQSDSSNSEMASDSATQTIFHALLNLLNTNPSQLQQQLGHQNPPSVLAAPPASSNHTGGLPAVVSQSNAASLAAQINFQTQPLHEENQVSHHGGNTTRRASTGFPPVTLYMACDEESLSAYQCLARQQVELFEASEEDVDTNAQGRNRPIVLGQVGIRCRHCAMIPTKLRAKGAVYYPAKLEGVYQAAQNMINSHLYEHCKQVPESVRSELVKLRVRKSSAGGGKKYWADGVRVLGVQECDHCLRFGGS